MNGIILVINNVHSFAMQIFQAQNTQSQSELLIKLHYIY